MSNNRILSCSPFLTTFFKLKIQWSPNITGILSLECAIGLIIDFYSV